MRKLDEKWLKKLTETDKGSWLKRRAHGQKPLTSSAAACSSRFRVVKKNKRFNPNCQPADYLTTVWYGQLLPAKYVFAFAKVNRILKNVFQL